MPRNNQEVVLTVDEALAAHWNRVQSQLGEMANTSAQQAAYYGGTDLIGVLGVQFVQACTIALATWVTDNPNPLKQDQDAREQGSKPPVMIRR